MTDLSLWPHRRHDELPVGIDAPEPDGVSLPVRAGERVRLVLENITMKWHPMHLHGHTFHAETGMKTVLSYVT